MFSHPAHLIALGFGSGLARWAPGTFGTLFGWLAFRALEPWVARTGLGEATWWLAIALLLVVGTWAAGRTGRDLGVADSGHVVIDEIVAIWIVLAMLPTAWSHSPWLQFGAFALFRYFDIVKPAPIGWVERRVPGGAGVMADDLVAAFYALLVLALIVRAWGG